MTGHDEDGYDDSNHPQEIGVKREKAKEVKILIHK
jgi:hypothetical protein